MGGITMAYTCRFAAVAAAAVALVAGAAEMSTAGAAELAKPIKMRLVYTAGPDALAWVAFTTNKELETKRNGKTLRGRAGVLGSNVSLHHFGGKKTCYGTPVSTAVEKRLRVGHRYVVTVIVGPENAERTYTRKVTLKRGTVALTRHELGC
jgi:hypothetical protein